MVFRAATSCCCPFLSIRFTIDQSPGRIFARAFLAVASSSMNRRYVCWGTSTKSLKQIDSPLYKYTKTDYNQPIKTQ